MGGTEIKQGDVVEATFGPVIGREQNGVRPAIIFSTENYHISGMLFACPLTTQIKNFICNPIISPTKQNGLKKKSELLVGQMRAISEQRILKKIGSVDREILQKIFEGFDFLCDR
jgi:mRNA interferase MazF